MKLNIIALALALTGITQTIMANQQCAVYMARTSSATSPLSISYYAGQDFETGTSIPVVDMGIHLVDWKLQNTVHSTKLSREILKMAWTPAELISQFEDNQSEAGLALVSGLGFAGAYNPGFANTRWNHHVMLTRYNNAQVLDERVDPMATAVSEYFGMQMTACEHIPAGMELFPHPGDDFYLLQEAIVKKRELGGASHEDALDFIAQSKYTRADFILKEFADSLQEFPDFYAVENRAQRYWELILYELVEDETVQSLLPVNVTEIHDYLQTGSLIKNNPSILKSLESLESHGTCADNILVKTSSIPGAGRGAFAKRDIKAGQVVAPCPLMRIPEESLLMYDLDQVADLKQKPLSQLINSEHDLLPESAQLLMNYVFGHPDTSVLFYPYGPGVNYINHATYDSPFMSNVQMAWSTKPYHMGSHFLDLDLDTIFEQNISPFANIMDLVATRDIKEGEEILLDYGPSFDSELAAYKQHFKPSEPNSEPMANVLNALGGPFRTLKEEQENPYPPNVATACYIDEENSPVLMNPNTNTSAYKMSIPSKFTFNSANAVKIYNSTMTMDATEYRCNILYRNPVGDNDYLYLVKLVDGPDDGSTPYIVDVPHSSIIIVDAPYTSAMHMINTLRHYIEIPDPLMPDAWRDLAEIESEQVNREFEDYEEEEQDYAEDFLDEMGL